MAIKRHQYMIVLPLCAFSLMLAVSSYRQLTWFSASTDYPHNNRQVFASFNLFLSDRHAQFEDEVAELERVLKFMVWPSVEQPLRRRLLETYWQQANLSPFDGQLWLKILYQQSHLPDREQSVDWTLGRALATSGWLHKAFVNLSHYCISNRETLSTATGDACNELLARAIGQHRVRALPGALGLSERQIEQILEQAKQSL